jgi:hypothetical protein
MFSPEQVSLLISAVLAPVVPTAEEEREEIDLGEEAWYRQVMSAMDCVAPTAKQKRELVLWLTERGPEARDLAESLVVAWSHVARHEALETVCASGAYLESVDDILEARLEEFFEE